MELVCDVLSKQCGRKNLSKSERKVVHLIAESHNLYDMASIPGKSEKKFYGYISRLKAKFTTNFMAQSHHII